MIRRPRGVAAAYRAKPSWSGAWRVLAALALALTNPAGGWRWDGARADASLVLTAPEAEAAVAAGAPIRFAWEPLATADAYRVVFNDGERTGPWVERPAWESGSLPPGRYRWRVAARTATGLVWSGERTFQVGGGAAAGELAESQPAAPLARLDLGAGGAVVGTRLSVTGAGFAPGETVAFAWERLGQEAPERATAGDDGAWTTPVLVPEAPGGVATLAARGETSGALARAALTILPSLERTPAGGPPRAQIDVTLRGFAPNEQVALHWETDGPTLATALTHGDGAARIRFAIPDAAAGIGSLVAIGQSSGDRAAATLRVDPAPSAEPDATPPAPERPTVGTNQTTGPGSFAVQAALTGSGGGATTSGHAITADDRFAALPVCVTTSCPWLDPGVNHPLWGVRVECGAACFVRVTDPASGRCVVAPALDVGPWFSDDDWWDAAPHRRINRLDGAIYTLATGYAAAAAARDGYDVGFGLSPDGVGISDRGYEVGDGAALGLAPGSWADLGFAPDRGVAGVEATLLWLTGDDPATATAECAAANATLPAIAPTEPAPAALATPSPTTAAPSIAADASTSQPVAAPSASPIVPADPPAVAAPAAATVDSPPAKNDDAGNRSDASGAADARGSQHTANRPRPSEDDSGRPNERSSARRDRRDQDRETAPEISASS